jgi:ATP-dependent exoDNAse (exonuclease V) beta subunit
MKEQEDERELLEEHRKLYVAMTRARDYLILTAARPKMNRTSWQKWVMDHAGLEWKSLAYGVIEKGDFAQGNGYRILVNGDVPTPAPATRDNEHKPWKLLRDQFSPQTVTSDTASATGPSLLFPVGDPASLQMPTLSASAYMAYHQCARRFYFRYLLMLPEMEVKNLPVLADISAHSLPDGEESEIIADTDADGVSHTAETQSKPSRKRVHASVRGTLVHELFEQIQSDDNLRELIRGHVESAKGIPADAQAELMDYLEKMARSYLNSPWFRPDSHREQSFYLKVGNSLVHGFMDAVLPEEDDTLTVVDFKTNEIRGEEHLRELTDKYRLQLQLYALGARAVFQKPVNRAVLFFLDAEISVDIDVQAAEVEKLAADLQHTCEMIMERSTIDSYPLTEDHTDCTRCGYRVLCGRTEGAQ